MALADSEGWSSLCGQAPEAPHAGGVNGPGQSPMKPKFALVLSMGLNGILVDRAMARRASRSAGRTAWGRRQPRVPSRGAPGACRGCVIGNDGSMPRWLPPTS